MCGRSQGPHSQAGQNTLTRSDFMKPGGTFMRRRFEGMSPKVRASRWMQIASNGQPSTMARVLGRDRSAAGEAGI
jgi:hypothetical protein